MVAEGFEDRVRYFMIAGAIELVILLAFFLVVSLVIRGKLTKSDLVAAKLMLTAIDVFTIATSGLVFALAIFAFSLFRTGDQAVVTRGLGIVAFVAIGAISIIYGLWKYLTLKAPPTEQEYALAEAAAERAADRHTGWPAKPTYMYRWQTSELVLISISWAAVAAIIVPLGPRVLLTEWAPGLMPQAIAADALRGIGDPTTDGLVLLGVGIVWAIGGSVLLWRSWKQWLRKRPLAINARGIYAFRRGRPWRLLAWNQVISISKHRHPEDQPLRPRVDIQIEGPGTSLLVTQEVNDFARLRQLVSHYAREHAIKMQLIDKGKDTMKAQRRLLAPPRYKEIARTGVITDVAEL